MVVGRLLVYGVRIVWLYQFTSKGTSSMKKAGVFLLPLFLILALGIGACGKSAGGNNNPGTSTPSNQVAMDATNFVNNTVSVKAGASVHFDDPADSGGTHIICVGENGQCSNDANAPKDLQGSGFTINAGQTKDVTFDKAGTYKVTCSIHPDMNLTVTVQ
ncbi:MAG TPA: plastocyanin/azurin family copper-binding protein [Ktedonobacterales bacterium]|jgi:plastocyanin|nr:plastocyanin/azurin family copper-binding protein [Ktedonobacterales bacterium]